MRGNLVCDTTRPKISFCLFLLLVLQFTRDSRDAYNAIAPALPLPSSSPTLEAVLSACAVAVQLAIAALSAAESVDAVAPPVPSLAMAAMAGAEIVREL